VIGSWEEEAMHVIELAGLLVAIGLLAYLTVALLKPEWFA
jgi:K+-transporting ATPase KdpF subunit